MKTLPTFTLKNQHNESVTIEANMGKPLVVYFYPKNDTPGCTAEACSFRDQYEDFTDAGAEVIGISADSVEKHLTFAKKHRLPFTLLSDGDNKVRKLFKVPKSFLGLLPGRVTYIYNGKGELLHQFNSQMEATKHVSEALKTLRD